MFGFVPLLEFEDVQRYLNELDATQKQGHASNSVGDRYRHQLRGQLQEDAARLEAFLIGDVAPVVLITGTQRGTRAA